ncbi:MAG TPA: hypothetical protein VJ957_00215, partial [Longimicrobiales bacterium]|nr:hypothetical protein [Longimicrobiales bacterium]
TVDGLMEFQGGHYLPDYTGYQNARRGVWYPCYDVQQKMVEAQNTGNTGLLDGITALQRGRCSLDDYNSDFWVEKADFWKLRSVSVSYRLPDSWFSFANRVILTLSGTNLLTITDYSGTDPEVMDFADYAENVFDGAGDFGRRDYYQIPSPRQFMLSARVSF